MKEHWFIGLVSEVKMLSKILYYNGFEVNSVICKNGNILKDFIDVIESEKVAMCNPLAVIYQAEAYYKDKLFPIKDIFSMERI